MSLPDSQGVADLRRRVLERASTVLWDETFRAKVVEARATWNAAHPKFKTDGIRMPESGDLSNWTAELVPGRATFAPSRLVQASHLDMASVLPILMDWEWASIRLANGFWSRNVFQSPQPARNPAMHVVQAAMVFELSSIDPELFVPPLTLTAVPLFYQPPTFQEMLHLVRGDAQVDVLWDALRSLLRDNPDELAAIAASANEYADIVAARRFGDGPMGHSEDPADWYYHVPLYPGMSGRDLKDAADEIADLARRQLGKRTTKGRVRELNDAGFSRPEIMKMLGASESTVRRALKSSDLNSSE